MKKNNVKTRKARAGIKLDILTAHQMRAEIRANEELYTEILKKYAPKADEYDTLRALREVTSDSHFATLMREYVMPQRLALKMNELMAYIKTPEEALDCTCILVDALAELRRQYL